MTSAWQLVGYGSVEHHYPPMSEALWSQQKCMQGDQKCRVLQDLGEMSHLKQSAALWLEYHSWFPCHSSLELPCKQQVQAFNAAAIIPVVFFNILIPTWGLNPLPHLKTCSTSQSIHPPTTDMCDKSWNLDRTALTLYQQRLHLSQCWSSISPELPLWKYLQSPSLLSASFQSLTNLCRRVHFFTSVTLSVPGGVEGNALQLAKWGGGGGGEDKIINPKKQELAERIYYMWERIW